MNINEELKKLFDEQNEEQQDELKEPVIEEEQEPIEFVDEEEPDEEELDEEELEEEEDTRKQKVTEEEYDEETEEVANNGRNNIKAKAITAICALIIVGSLVSLAQTQNKKNENKSVETTEQTQEEQVIEIETEENDITIPEYDIYQNADTFYNKILEQRKTYGNDFASSFNDEEDVKDFIYFINSFNTSYDTEKRDLSNYSTEYVEELIKSYYESCIKYNVTPELNTLFINEYLQKKLAESENLAANLINGKNDDYTISNDYYKWMGENVVDDDGTKYISRDVTQNTPLLLILIDQYSSYRCVGNMVDARKNQKTYDLNINGSTEYACPDGIDNVLISDTDFGTISTNNQIYENVENQLNYIKGINR